MPPPPLHSRVHRFAKYLPLFLCLLAISLEAIRLKTRPIQYIAIARLKISSSAPDQPTLKSFPKTLVREFFETQIEVIQSHQVHLGALHRLNSLHPNLQPAEVSLKVLHHPGSTFLSIGAFGTQSEYPAHYLDAVIDEYLSWRKNVMDISKKGSIQMEPDFALTVLQRPQPNLIHPPPYRRNLIIAAIIGTLLGWIMKRIVERSSHRPSPAC
ncbi:hypothetical protein FEM03_02905 [Phragmitibacter flavus]|uniref:Polysaccharide chain length determinant N-terminal domain-containing protein n=1 Tax=Phragmitibacter flavus TaxID=2576071 RepID=A0A5R8KJ93_9BACT|nr:hypothetical protein [Phragmitibacter flavus]TLD72320.1 hypothetical protein FEM03_02905 [Phragmitibacter flavus]